MIISSFDKVTATLFIKKVAKKNTTHHGRMEQADPKVSTAREKRKNYLVTPCLRQLHAEGKTSLLQSYSTADERTRDKAAGSATK